MTDNIPIHPSPDDALLNELASQLLDCGAVLSQIIRHMVRCEAQASDHVPPEFAPIPDLARGLVTDVLHEVKRRHSRRDLRVAAAIVGEATDAISSDIFIVDPAFIESFNDQTEDDAGA